MVTLTIFKVGRKSRLVYNIKHQLSNLVKMAGCNLKVKSGLSVEEIPYKKIKLIDIEPLQRTVATMCGAWRPEEDDGGLNLVLKTRQPCLSPDPERECDYPENIEDFWLAAFQTDDDKEVYK